MGTSTRTSGLAQHVSSTRTRGRRNSSVTRVRPLFRRLFYSDEESDAWLARLLASAPQADRLPQDVLAHPGELDPALLKKRERGRSAGLERAFEFPVPPPAAFLRYLLSHPDKLSWPLRRGKQQTYRSSLTMRYRTALLFGSESERDDAIRLGLERLERVGTRGTRDEPAWWLFEGYTKVDCCLSTERLVLFIEGKRTETLSKWTDWYPTRNQLVRNLEAIGEVAAGRACRVLLIGEEGVPELDDSIYEQSLPHLEPRQRSQVRGRYLGQTTWARVCNAVGVPFDALPDEV
jgi:hypothetical protein